MKKTLLTAIVFLILLTGCKKDNSGTDKKDIEGTWYYQSYDVQYFDSNQQLMYDDVASAAVLHNDPTYTFNKDLSGTYNTTSFDYQITSHGGVDSLILTGDGNLRFRIVSITKNSLVLERSYPVRQYFDNQNHQFVVSAFGQSHGTFSRVQAP